MFWPEKLVVPIWFLLDDVLQQSRVSKIKTKHLDSSVSFQVPLFWSLDTQYNMQNLKG